MNLAKVVHLVATNPAFATGFIQEPRKTLRTAGLTLDDDSLAAVLAVMRENPRWPEWCSPALEGPETFPWWQGVQPEL